MTRRNYVISNFICSECGITVPLPRNHGRQREHGHCKDMWCPSCMKESKFKEIRYKEFYRSMAGELLIV